MLQKKDIAREGALIGLGAACGLAWGWPGASALLGLSALIPLAWSCACNRYSAALVLLAYYLGASRGLPAGTGIFFAETAPVWLGWALWVGVAVLNSLVWLLCWSTRPNRRAIGALSAVALTALPPIGLVGWANPLIAAGILFPGFGFIGLALLMLAWAAVARGVKWPLAYVAVAGVVANTVGLSVASNPAGWVAQDTHYGRLGSGSSDFMAAYRRVRAVQDAADELAPGRVLVMPETLVGRYTSATEFLLSDTAQALAKKGSAVIVGGELPGPRGTERLSNALIVIDGKGTRPLLQRVPVPIGMWKPWSAANAFEAHPFASGIATVAGQRIAYAICYEQLLTYPLLLSFAQKPTLLIGAANDWWAKTTSIPLIQGQVLDTWGRLFAVPVVRATNI